MLFECRSLWLFAVIDSAARPAIYFRYVEAGDALLVCDAALYQKVKQKVKEIVEALKKTKRHKKYI